MILKHILIWKHILIVRESDGMKTTVEDWLLIRTTHQAIWKEIKQNFMISCRCLEQRKSKNMILEDYLLRQKNGRKINFWTICHMRHDFEFRLIFKNHFFLFLFE